MAPSQIHAVTFDFWNTLFDDSGEPPRHHRRLQCFHEVLRREGVDGVRFDDITHAFREAFLFANRAWKEEHRTIDSRTRIEYALRQLDIQLSPTAIDEVTAFFEDVLLDDPPQLLPGLDEVLPALAERMPLAIISDTGYSPGGTLRRLLEQTDIAHYFSVFVFSDETGCAKPEPKAFHTALEGLSKAPDHVLHIGDIERTDVTGARNVGMAAALYTGGAPRSDSPVDASRADIILRHHHDLRDLLDIH